MYKQSNCALTFCIHWRLRKEYARLKKCCSSNVLCKHRCNVAFYKLSSCESEKTRWGSNCFSIRERDLKCMGECERESRTNGDLPKYTFVVITLQYGLYYVWILILMFKIHMLRVTAFLFSFFRERLKNIFCKNNLRRNSSVSGRRFALCIYPSYVVAFLVHVCWLYVHTTSYDVRQR